jgi:hypothetical protein
VKKGVVHCYRCLMNSVDLRRNQKAPKVFISYFGGNSILQAHIVISFTKEATDANE